MWGNFPGEGDYLQASEGPDRMLLPLMPIAKFLALNSDGIPRTLVNKNGKQLSSLLLVFLEGDDDDDVLAVALPSSFCRLVGGDFSNSSSLSVSES